MSYRSLVLAVAALSSMHVTNAEAQSVYVAPGGVYVGSGPVYVIPAPNNGAPPYVAPTYGYEYGPPAVMAPGPAVVAPTTVYGPNGGYYGAPLSGYGPSCRRGRPRPCHITGAVVASPATGTAGNPATKPCDAMGVRNSSRPRIVFKSD